MVSHTYAKVQRPTRENYWQDWANAVLAVWLFISPWIVFGTYVAPAAGNGGGAVSGAGPLTAAWNAWVLGVIVFIVAVSAISRMDFWQEWVNLVLGIWIFIAPWVLDFTRLAAASWDHWIVGALIFLLSIFVLSRARDDRARVTTTTASQRPPGAP